MKRYLLSISALTLIVLGFSEKLSAQCSGAVPTFMVDLSSSPTATYLSPNTGRAGVCCVASDNCVEFVVLL